MTISKGKGESESAAVTVPPCKGQDLETVEVSCLHDTRKISTGSPKGHGGQKKRGLEHLLLTDKAPRWVSFFRTSKMGDECKSHHKRGSRRADRREVLNGALRESCCVNAVDPGQIPDEPARISCRLESHTWRSSRLLWVLTGIRGR